MALTSAQITLAFQNVLQRDPSAAELSAWLNTSTSGALTDAQIYAAIVNSAEAQNGAAAIIRVYQAAFGRVPDKAGLDQQTDSFMRGGFTINKIAEGFVVSQEFANRYNGGTLVTDNAAAVTDALLQSLYQNVLGRAGSAAEIAAWKATLTTPGSGYTKASDVLIGFSQSVEFSNKAAGAITTFLTAAAQGTAVYSGALLDPAVGTGSTYALTTGVDVFTGTGGGDTFNANPGAANANTFTALDSIDGGAGTDTINVTEIGAAGAASYALNTAATVKNVETLNYTVASDNVGDDVTANVSTWTGLTTANVVISGTAAPVTLLNTNGNVTSASVTGATTSTITDAAAAGADKLATVSMTKTTGLATINSDALTTLNMTTATGGATINAAAGTRVVSLSVNASSGVVTDAEATGLKVAATGANSAGLTLTAAKATSIEFSGDKTVSTALGAQAATLAITSSNTGGVTITTALADTTAFAGGDGKDTVTVGTTTKAITGGKGDDTINVTVAALGSGGSVNGGDGTDTLGFATFAHAVTASGATTFAGTAQGFEALSLNGANGAAGATVNLANLNDGAKNAITKVIYAATNTATSTISNLLSGNTVEFTIDQTDTQTATLSVKDALAGTADVLNVGLKGGAVVKAFDVDISNVETINFLTTDTQATPTGLVHQIDLVAAAAKTITVAGNAGLTITTNTGTALTSFDATGVTKGGVTVTTGALAAAATLKGGAGDDTINAAAATKAVTIEGGAGVDTITGSTAESSTLNGGDGNDTITGGNKADTISGGAGNDTINSGTGLDIIDVGAGDDTFTLTANANGNTYATLTGMGKGDKINLLDGGAAGTFTTAKITLADTAAFADFLEAAAASTAVATGANSLTVWFQFGGNTYLVQDRSTNATFTNGTDQVVKLTGLVDLSTATIDGAATNVLTLG